MLSPNFLFPRFFVFPSADPSNFFKLQHTVDDDDEYKVIYCSRSNFEFDNKIHKNKGLYN